MDVKNTCVTYEGYVIKGIEDKLYFSKNGMLKRTWQNKARNDAGTCLKHAKVKSV
jgi:hypothetical protein